MTSTAAMKANASAPVEEIRVIATILLVLFHVIGTPGSGLKIDTPGGLRLVADIMADFRMPAFAFVAGFIYALRPATIGAFDAFIAGKVRRLVIPGVIAALLFAVTSNLLHTSLAIGWDQLWRPLVLPYAHYWFLQSILTLFVIVGIVDAVTRHRAELPLLTVALILYFLSDYATEIFSLSRTMSLAPFFIAGLCIQRRQQWIIAHGAPATIICLGMVALWALLTINDLSSATLIRADERRTEALLIAAPLCILAILYVPHHPKIRVIGQFSFTIYLYHIFATAGARMALHKLGITDLSVHLITGLAAGLSFPIMLHLTIMPWPLGARMMLGLKQAHPLRVDRLARAG